MTPLWEASTTVLAQGGGLGTGGLRQWMLENVVPLALLCLACLFLFLGGAQGNNSGIMKRLGGVFIGLGILGLAVTGAGVNVGSFIAGLFTTG